MERGLRQVEQLRRVRAERARLEVASAQREERACAAVQRAQRGPS